MLTVGIRDLKQRASELVRLVRETNNEVLVTYRGKVVARLIPAERSAPGGESEAWAQLDHLAAEIGASWPAGLSANEAVSESRR
jgi:prevent-host-death family protein